MPDEVWIYEEFLTEEVPMPAGRNTTGPDKHKRFPVPASAESRKSSDQTKAAVHELAHELAKFLGYPPSYSDYRREVGWTASGELTWSGGRELYDMDVKIVRDAITAGTPIRNVLSRAAAQNFLITKGNWWSNQFGERPLTEYMVDHPQEDFAEAVMAYVNVPTLLRERSPRRYKFIADRIANWRIYLSKRPT